MRRLRERFNRVLGRHTCLFCGRHMPESGGYCRCGGWQSGVKTIPLVPKDEYDRFASRFGSPS